MTPSKNLLRRTTKQFQRTVVAVLKQFKDMNKQQKNKNKKLNEMGAVFQDMKIKIEMLKNTQPEMILRMKNLIRQIKSSVGSFINRMDHAEIKKSGMEARWRNQIMHSGPKIDLKGNVNKLLRSSKSS